MEKIHQLIKPFSVRGKAFFMPGDQFRDDYAFGYRRKFGSFTDKATLHHDQN
jgi:hypothetical protein